MAQRFSKKREATYTCLCSTDTHPTADWIYQQLRLDYPDLSLATVYRHLSQLKQAGLIQSVGIVDGQERFDAVTTPHTHFICTACGQIRDLWDVSLPPELCRRAEAATGCQITGTFLRLTGRCPGCQRLTT